jgi:hypothetical protein
MPLSASDYATRHIYVMTYVIVTEHALVYFSTDVSRAPFMIVFNFSERTPNFPLIEEPNIKNGLQCEGYSGLVPRRYSKETLLRVQMLIESRGL